MSTYGIIGLGIIAGSILGIVLVEVFQRKGWWPFV